MAVLVVIPGEELLGEGTGILKTPEAFRETGPVFQSPEVAFRIWVVVGDMGAAVGFGDTQVGHQKSDGFGCHGGTPVRMNCQLSRLDLLFAARIRNEPFGQFRTFTVGHHPAHHIALATGAARKVTLSRTKLTMRLWPT